MKRCSIFILFFLLISAFLFGCGSSSDDNIRSSVSGMVVDMNYNPISGATITNGSLIAYSRSDGSYVFSSISSSTKVFSLSSPRLTTSYRKYEKDETGSTIPIAILAPLDTKTTQIGTGGGLVSNTDGSIKLDIPASALGTATDITLTKVKLIAAPTPPPIGSQFIAVIVYVSPNNINLGAFDAKLSIPNLTGLPSGTSVPFYHLNIDTVEWELIADANGIASLESGTITADISLFGWTAAIVQIAPSVGIIEGVIRDLASQVGIEGASVWTSYFSTVTGKNGAYTLDNIPTGESLVEAIAPGYNISRKLVTLEAGETITQHLNLTKLNVGSVIGNIYNSYTLNVIPESRIMLQPSGQETLTDDNGNYTFYNVPVGTISIFAFANGYLGNSASGYLASGQTLIKDIGLVPTTESGAWSDDFETDKGWTTSFFHPSCQWQRTQNPHTIHNSLDPTYVSLPGSNDLPLPKSGNYVYWFGVTPECAADGCYIGIQDGGDIPDSGGLTATNEVAEVEGDLISPVIDLTAFAFANLSFWTWWETESINIASGFDKMLVYISTDYDQAVPNWVLIGVLNPLEDPDQTEKMPNLPYSSGGFNKDGAWIKHSYDLTSYVGNKVKIKFTFDSVDSQYNGFRGWVIDDFAVNSGQIGVSSISETAVEKRSDGGIINSLPR